MSDSKVDPEQKREEERPQPFRGPVKELKPSAPGVVREYLMETPAGRILVQDR